MKNETILIANITTLKKMGTTVFFRCLKENPTVKGEVLLGKNNGYLEFSLTELESLDNIKTLLSATDFFSSATRINKRESLRCKPGSSAEIIDNKLMDFFKTREILIRAETEKADYRTQSHPTVFKCILNDDVRDLDTDTVNKVYFTEEASKSFEVIDKQIKNAEANKHSNVSFNEGVVQGF